MNKKNFILGIATSVLMVNGMFAVTPNDESVPFDVNSVEYIEEDTVIDLGFDTADYLPEGFDPYRMYVDFNAITYIEDEEIELSDLSEYLPANFDAYAYPKDIMYINYIDENDDLKLDFETKKHLPEGFNAYIK